MSKVPIKIVCESGMLPVYGSELASGCDLKANITDCDELMLGPLERAVIPTGVRISMPEGWEAQVRPRSGHCAKKGLVAALGTIDADYRGEIGVIVMNLSNEYHSISRGERVAQLVFARVDQAEFTQVDTLDETARGTHGFGSTGAK